MKKISVIRQQSAAYNQQLIIKLIVLVFTVHCSLFTVHCFAQGVGINIKGNSANSKALLDVDATGMNPMTGVLIPRMNTNERNTITAPIPESLLIYNTDTHCFEGYYNGWVDFLCPANGCQVPAQPTPGTNTATMTSITWNWSDASSLLGYVWGTSSSYGSAIGYGTSVSYTETGLTCNTPYSFYVWAYNACGNSSYITLTQTTSSCSPQCGSQTWAIANLVAGQQISTSSYQFTAGDYWCYQDIAANCTTYGGLYEWASAMNLPYAYNSTYATATWGTTIENCNPCGPTTGKGGVTGLCPTGYHIPSDLEWSQYEWCIDALQAPVDTNSATNTLIYFQTTFDWRGSTLPGVGPADKMKGGGRAMWGLADNGTNSSGFNALPGGWCQIGGSGNSVCEFQGEEAYYWTTMETASVSGLSGAYIRTLWWHNSQSDRGWNTKPIGSAVRCLQD